MSHEHANTKCNLLRILFMFIVSKYAVKEVQRGNQFETLKGNEIRLRGSAVEWNMNMMQRRKGTPLLSIGTGSRSDRDRRGCWWGGWRGRWRLLVPANDSERIRGSWCRCCQSESESNRSVHRLELVDKLPWLKSFLEKISISPEHLIWINLYITFGFDWPYLVLWSLKAEFQSSAMLIFADFECGQADGTWRPFLQSNSLVYGSGSIHKIIHSPLNFPNYEDN